MLISELAERLMSDPGFNPKLAEDYEVFIWIARDAESMNLGQLHTLKLIRKAAERLELLGIYQHVACHLAPGSGEAEPEFSALSGK